MPAASAGRTLRMPRGGSRLTRTVSRSFNPGLGHYATIRPVRGTSSGSGEMITRCAWVVSVGMALGASALAQTPGTQPAGKGRVMTDHASGTFEVKMQPLPADEKVPGLAVGRFAFDKTWKGAFEGTSKG